MTELTTKDCSNEVLKYRWNRDEVADNLVQFEEIRAGKSQRQAAEEMGVPRTTLQHWLKRKDSLDASPTVIAFFESPEGLAFLHRLVIAVQFVMLLVSNGSIRVVHLFMELSGLDIYVAGSYGTQQKIAVAMENEVVSFGQQERTCLAQEMVPKKITACEDETFHPEICLVAIEPISNFILLEKYSKQRDAQTWTDSIQKVLSDLPVSLIQVTSDEAKGLLRHTRIELGVHHSPDLFHGLREISKGIFPALLSQVKQAQKEYDKTIRETRCHMQDSYNWETQQHHKPGRPPDFNNRIQIARKKEDVARQAVETTVARKERAKEILQEIGDAYHPFDLATGAPRQTEQVKECLEKNFSDLDQIALEASLSERSIQHIDKARRLVPSMLETITFFWSMVSTSLKDLSFPLNIEHAMRQNLIPAYYLQYAAGKAKTAAQRQAIQKVIKKLLAPLLAPDGPFSVLDEDQIRRFELVAKECAGFFQRSSSCVEGRNGQLSLRHHNQHRIGTRKLQALTVVHNFFITRSDGTTAAERFFGAKPKALFNHLLDKIDLPARPARSRPRPQSGSLLLAIA